MADYFEIVPNELICIIWSFLGFKHWIRASLISKKFQNNYKTLQNKYSRIFDQINGMRKNLRIPIKRFSGFRNKLWENKKKFAQNRFKINKHSIKFIRCTNAKPFVFKVKNINGKYHPSLRHNEKITHQIWHFNFSEKGDFQSNKNLNAMWQYGQDYSPSRLYCEANSFPDDEFNYQEFSFIFMSLKFILEFLSKKQIALI